jgi:YidC/Oxa1 family membrane protein insertase
MRVLKPEIDELKAKYGDDQAKFGQEQMKLFKQAGVSPLGGCLPLLLQLPILAAMYTFFPQSIELRQQHFWWVNDLSTYDSIFDFNTAIPFYGSHVSLWTIIMTITSIGFAVYNNQLSGVTGQMKWMAYIMPVMLLGIFNSLPAALTYYYSLSNVIAFLQQWLVKNFIIDEKAIHRQIQENKKKPVKKSSWAKRLEDLQRSQQQKQKGK